ncbi:hypothetical protein Leryth_000049 [Lithospermum erythrorhizon]|nr:hypothetical protein Leryth_000049 [Lithospermum erythrorhizon]
MVTKNIVCSVSSSILEIKMGSLFEKRVEIGVKKDGYGEFVNEDKIFVGNSMGEHGRVSSSSDIYTSQEGVNEEQNMSCSTNSMAWLVMNDNVLHSSSSSDLEVFEKPHLDYRILEKQGPVLSEIEMMKERFAKLLLGEDMSGCGNGVCTALALSNAITNLCASIFGQIWRLVPLPVEKKLMWRREIEWLISISDHIVELIPSLQTFPDGSKIEVCECYSISRS